MWISKQLSEHCKGNYSSFTYLVKEENSMKFKTLPNFSWKDYVSCCERGRNKQPQLLNKNLLGNSCQLALLFAEKDKKKTSQIVLNLFLKDCIYLFLERGGEKP